MRVLGIVPVRLESKRFPNKAIELFNSQPLFVYAYHALSRAKGIDRSLVVTDSPKVKSICEGLEIPCYYDTSKKEYLNGTERCAAYLWNGMVTRFTHVINVQCDEPDITADDIDNLIAGFDTGHCVFTLAGQGKMNGKVDINNPVVVVNNNIATLFTRKDTMGNVYNHIGVYGYTLGALIDYENHGPSVEEKIESLEQLRWEPMHRKIYVVHVDGERRSINVPDDLKRIADK